MECKGLEIATLVDAQVILLGNAGVVEMYGQLIPLRWSVIGVINEDTLVEIALQK